MSTATRRIALISLFILSLDQFTKQLVKTHLALYDEKVIIKGFFRFVHWANTGAAWSLLNGNNKLLAVVAIVALFVLFRSRHHFDSHRLTGQIALGLIFGGIVGNLTDRLHFVFGGMQGTLSERLNAGYVTDFLYFYIQQRGGREIGFPAFNVADSAICIGVGLIFLLSWKNEKLSETSPSPAA